MEEGAGVGAGSNSVCSGAVLTAWATIDGDSWEGVCMSQ